MIAYMRSQKNRAVCEDRPVFLTFVIISRKKWLCAVNPSFGGISKNGAYGIRTRDLHTASVARSQLR